MDESYDGTANSEYIHIAGYLFQKQKAKEFSRVWGNFLRARCLPHFHMADCAHGNDVFARRTDCDEIARKLIQLTRQYTQFGFAVSVRQADYAALVAPREGLPQSPYAFALFAAMLRVRAWTERTGFKGEIAYFFEDGHDDKHEADGFMKWMFGSEMVARNSSYAGHTFVEKCTPGLHPADMLAWHWNAEVVRRNDPKRRGVRRDFQALLREQDFVTEYDLKGLQALATALTAAEARWRTPGSPGQARG